MLRTSIKIILIFLSLFQTSFAKTIRQKQANFEVSEQMLSSFNNFYSFQEYKGRSFQNSSLSSLDVEHLAQKRNTRIFFSKFLFNIDIPISKIDGSIFYNTQIIKRIMGAKEISKIDLENHIWKSTIPILIVKVKSKLQVKQLYRSDIINDVYGDYFSAVDELEPQLSKGDYQVHMRLTDFNVGFDKLVVICNFIKQGNKTVVLTYIVARANNKWWKKRNLFGVASKTMRNLILKVGTDTKRVLVEGK